MKLPRYSFSQIEHRSAAFWKAVELRQEVLRRPLSLTLTVEEILLEGPPQAHFGLFGIGDSETAGPILACASVIPQPDGSVKIRQVAVAEAWQGQGLGNILMQSIESDLRYLGEFHTIQLHARQNVQGFYEKLGYEVIGEPFEEIGIPHVLMVKRVAG